MHRLLSGILVPLIAWGMIASLVSHLVDLRSLFIEAGESRLRFAVFAFAAGVILIQRLTIEQGNESAAAYKWALGFTMGLFNLWFCTQPSGFHPAIVFFVNAAVFVALWWVAFRITEACAVDSEEAANAASESGVLRFSRPSNEAPAPQPIQRRSYLRDTRVKRTDLKPQAAPETTWQQRLSTRHPGRVLFAFALVAFPLFGLGVLLFPPEEVAGVGIHLFIFLWCALFLLALSSLRQLDAYVRRRNMTLPDVVGLTWLGLGVSIVTIVVAAGFLLPQPPNTPGSFVRDRVFATFDDARSRFGFHEAGPGGGKRARDTAGDDGERRSLTDMVDDRTKGDKELAEGGETAYIKPPEKPEKRVSEAAQKAFNYFYKGIGFITALAILFVLVVVAIAFWTSFRTYLHKRPKKEKKKKPKKAQSVEVTVAVAAIPDPLAGDQNDVNALAERIWEATVAFCVAMGAQSSSDQTPYEFLASKPEGLSELETEAATFVNYLMQARYSNAALPESVRPKLKDFWRNVRTQVA